MACNIADICDAPCGSPAFGPTAANWAVVELLLQVLHRLAPTAVFTADGILDATDCLSCLTEAQAREKQYVIVKDGLGITNIARLHCKTPAQVEAVKLYAICSIINVINP